MKDGLARDLDEILERAADDLDALAGERLYITGGTGFVGSWLLRAIAHANRHRSTPIRADVLTRDPDAFARREPALAGDPSFVLRQGTIAAPAYDGRYDRIIHAATPTAADVRRHTNADLRREIGDGMRALLHSIVAQSGAVPVLFVSSGAVYGAQPPEIAAIPETFAAPENAAEAPNGYRDGKRDAEALLADAQGRGTCRMRLARLFAFLGPGLPLDEHFAAGNFIRDALALAPIRVSGDGTASRSYLYPTDLIVWLLAVLVRGEDGRAYNIGSDRAISIAELAHAVRRVAQLEQSVIIGTPPTPGSARSAYIPDVCRITDELGVRRTVELDEAILRTLESHAPLQYRAGSPL